MGGVGGAAAAEQPHALRSSSPQQAAAASSTSPSLPPLHVTRLSARQLRVQAGDYTLHIDNMDGYMDLTAVDVQCWACLEQGHLSLDGLLGQTWNSSARMVHDEEGVEQFRVQGDDEAGCSSAMHDRHCTQAERESPGQVQPAQRRGRVGLGRWEKGGGERLGRIIRWPRTVERRAMRWRMLERCECT